MEGLDDSTAKTLSKKSDFEVYKISISIDDGYTLEAIDYCKELLAKRKVSASEIDDFENRIKIEKDEKKVKANIEANFFERFACFLFPGMIQFLIFSDLDANGYKRKARQLRLASRAGVFFYILLVVYALV